MYRIARNKKIGRYAAFLTALIMLLQCICINVFADVLNTGDIITDVTIIDYEAYANNKDNINIVGDSDVNPFDINSALGIMFDFVLPGDIKEGDTFELDIPQGYIDTSDGAFATVEREGSHVQLLNVVMDSKGHITVTVLPGAVGIGGVSGRFVIGASFNKEAVEQSKGEIELDFGDLGRVTLYYKDSSSPDVFNANLYKSGRYDAQTDEFVWTLNLQTDNNNADIGGMKIIDDLLGSNAGEYVEGSLRFDMSADAGEPTYEDGVLTYTIPEGAVGGWHTVEFRTKATDELYGKQGELNNDAALYAKGSDESVSRAEGKAQYDLGYIKADSPKYNKQENALSWPVTANSFKQDISGAVIEFAPDAMTDVTGVTLNGKALKKADSLDALDGSSYYVDGSGKVYYKAADGCSEELNFEYTADIKPEVMGEIVGSGRLFRSDAVFELGLSGDNVRNEASASGRVALHVLKGSASPNPLNGTITWNVDVNEDELPLDGAKVTIDVSKGDYNGNVDLELRDGSITVNGEVLGRDKYTYDERTGRLVVDLGDIEGPVDIQFVTDVYIDSESLGSGEWTQLRDTKAHLDASVGEGVGVGADVSIGGSVSGVEAEKYTKLGESSYNPETGVLEGDIEVNNGWDTEKYTDGKLTVEIPEGFTDGKVTLRNSDGTYSEFTDGEVTVEGNKLTVDLSKHQNQNWDGKSNSLHFEFRTKDDANLEELYDGSIGLDMTYEANDGEVSVDSHFDIPIPSAPNITKNGWLYPNEANTYAAWEVQINPNKQELTDAVFVDELDPAFKVRNLVLYKGNTEYSGGNATVKSTGEVITDQYTITKENHLLVSIPDGRDAYVLRFETYVTSMADIQNSNIVNEAYMQGTKRTDKDNNSNFRLSFNINASGTGRGESAQISVRKLDSETDRDIYSGFELQLYWVNKYGVDIATDDNSFPIKIQSNYNHTLYKGDYYRLTEVKAPNGYKTADDIYFTVDGNGNVVYCELTEEGLVPVSDEVSTEVRMYDEPKEPNYKEIVFSKQALGGGDELDGAEITLQVIDSGSLQTNWGELTAIDGQYAVKTWITGEKDQDGKLKEDGKFRLKKDNYYRFTENKAPIGYLEAEDIYVYIDKDGSVYSCELYTDAMGAKALVKADKPNADNIVVMYDKTDGVKFSKQAIGGGDDLDGAKITLKAIDDKGSATADKAIDGNADVLTWVTGARDAEGNVIEDGIFNLKNDHYYSFTEEQAPDGYEVNAETIYIYVDADGEVHLCDMTDTGLAVKEEVVDARTVVMEDSLKTKDVKFSKQALGGGNELDGAVLTLTVVDENGREITAKAIDNKYTAQEWTTKTENGPVTFKLGYGNYYKLTEKTAPNGYELKEESIYVYVDKDGNVCTCTMGTDGKLGNMQAVTGETVVMEDKPETADVTFSKRAVGAGDELNGAELTVKAVDGKGTEKTESTAVEGASSKTWISGEEDGTFKLEKNSYYSFTENAAPAGYEINEETIYIYVDADGEVHLCDMTDTGLAVKEEAVDARTVVMEDKPKEPLRFARLLLSKQAAGGSKELEKAILSITVVGEDGEELNKGAIIDVENDRTEEQAARHIQWMILSSKEPRSFDLMTEQYYKYAEEKNPAGYAMADPIYFYLDAVGDIYICTLENGTLVRGEEAYSGNLIVMYDELLEEYGSITVKKSVVSYEKELSLAFRFGLFDKDSKLDEKELNYSEENNEVVFEGLTLNKEYYVYELDADGNKVENGVAFTVNGKTFIAHYTTNAVTLDSKDGKTVGITNEQSTEATSEESTKGPDDTDTTNDTTESSSETTTDVSTDTTAESSSETTTEEHHIPGGDPVQTTTEASTQGTTEAPTQTTTEASTQGTTETPTQTTTEASTQGTTEASTQTTTESSSETTTEKPHTPGGDPVQTTTEAPVQDTTEASTQGTTEAPTQDTTEAPTQGTTEAPTQDTTEAPTQDTNEPSGDDDVTSGGSLGTDPTEPGTEKPTEEEPDGSQTTEEEPTEGTTEAPREVTTRKSKSSGGGGSSSRKADTSYVEEVATEAVTDTEEMTDTEVMTDIDITEEVPETDPDIPVIPDEPDIMTNEPIAIDASPSTAGYGDNAGGDTGNYGDTNVSISNSTATDGKSAQGNTPASVQTTDTLPQTGSPFNTATLSISGLLAVILGTLLLKKQHKA